MPRGDVVRIDTVCVVEQAAELDPVVAHDARIGCASRCVFIDKIVDDVGKFGLQVERVKRNVHLVGNASGILGVRGAATPLFVRDRCVE